MIRLHNIVAEYTTKRGRIRAVDQVDLEVPDAVILGVAGESGCGKSTLMKVIYGDVQSPLALPAGSVDYGFEDERGNPVTQRTIRGQWFRRISYIPQSSMSSLNPVTRIREQFTDFLTGSRSRSAVLEEVRAYLRQLDLPGEVLDSYPHQLSGGMRQRVMVAMATFFEPDIILADEPTTALDVVVQKSILLLLIELQERMRNTIVFVSHDMGVHYQITHKMLIMYAAKAVEYGDSGAVFERPLHPYTRMLISSLPSVGDDQVREGVAGRPPSLWDELTGCRFAARCPLATELCQSTEPPMVEHRSGHFAACHFAGEAVELAGSTA